MLMVTHFTTMEVYKNSFCAFAIKRVFDALQKDSSFPFERCIVTCCYEQNSGCTFLGSKIQILKSKLGSRSFVLFPTHSHHH